MSAAVLKFQKNGTPAVLCDNLAEQAEHIEFMLVVCVMKCGEVRHHWSQVPNSLTALGAAETLKEAMLRNCDE
jgi:hypothetical protein